VPPISFWLRDAKNLLVPAEGRFRVFLAAFTDLPPDPRGDRAPVWNEQTWMGDARLPATAHLQASGVLSGWR